jgi:hypothetical protein
MASATLHPAANSSSPDASAAPAGSMVHLPLVMRDVSTCNTSQQAIVNPEFDDSSIAPWRIHGATERTSLGYLTAPYSMYLGGYDNAEDGLDQDVVVPGWAEYAQVLWATYMFSDDSTTEAYDALGTAVYAGDTRVSPVIGYWNNDTRGVWRQGTITMGDARSLRGQTLKLLYGGFTNGASPTGWLVDHVWFMFGCGAGGQAASQGYEPVGGQLSPLAQSAVTVDSDHMADLLDDLAAKRKALSSSGSPDAAQTEREQMLKQSVSGQ